MCRLAAFPPGTPPEQAHEIVTRFVGGNDDGVGEAYVKDGKFFVNKYPYSYKDALSKGDALFHHMPFNGWTIAHVRYATHGGNDYKNTHPFIKGDIAVVHNGVFGAADIIRAAIADSVKWSGDTDTEVAAYMLSKLGSEKFYEVMNKYGSPGVFLSLRRDGALTAVKIGGDLEIFRLQNETLMLASRFPYNDEYKQNRDVSNGILKFDHEGHAKNFKFEKEFREKKDYWSQGTKSGTSGREHGNTGGNCSTYTNKDIGFPRGMPACGESQETAAARTLQKESDVAITKPKVKRLELWSNWPSDEDLEKMTFE